MPLPRFVKLRALREASGLSLRKVARRMGISAPYLSDLERGNRHLNPEILQRFQKAIKNPTLVTT